jgi:hypothetical protein
LTPKFAQEQTRHNAEAVATFHVDFYIAYDQVMHFHIWKIIQSMGFASDFIVLLQGIVEPGSAKVHLNALSPHNLPCSEASAVKAAL